MHDFECNFNAISIAYGKSEPDITIFESQRKVFSMLCDFIFSGAVFKKDTLRWLICRCIGYGNGEIKEKYEKRYGKKITLNTIAATKTAVYDELTELLGDDFMEHFCECESKEKANEEAIKAFCRLCAIKNLKCKSFEMYIYEITEAYYKNKKEGYVKCYGIDELADEIALLAKLSFDNIRGLIDKVDASKLSYLVYMMDGYATKDEKVNQEKIAILDAIENEKFRLSL